MMSEETALAVAETLQQEREKRELMRRQARTYKFFKLGAASGFVIGALAGYLVYGQVFPWPAIGLIAGSVLGFAYGKYAA